MPVKARKSIYTNYWERLKEEFWIQGLDNWPSHRVLELLLFCTIPQGDVNKLAHVLANRFGSLAGVLDALPDELRKIPDMEEHTLTLLKLLPALFARYQKERSVRGTIVDTPADAARELSDCFFAARQEMVWILCLDGKREVLGVRKVSEGSIHSSSVSIRRIAEEALSLRAAAIYLAHNHISGLAFPSGADWTTTDTVRAALSPIGLELIDHLIFVDGDFLSLNEFERDRKRPICRSL